MKFTKMEGCGNDYIYINCLEETVEYPELLAVDMSERHFGVGADGLVLILPSEIADFRMRMFNMDGSEGEMCGNAVRCIGKYVYERALTDKKIVTLETLAGIKVLQLHITEENIVKSVTVDMGEPILDANQIPLSEEFQDSEHVVIEVLDKTFTAVCVSMGNPHAVIFVDDVMSFPVELYGSAAEIHHAFPNRCNIEFVEVINGKKLKMRVWERGSGETLACGTGASASLVAAIQKGYCDQEAEVEVLGGTLSVRWDEMDNHVYMTGPARFSFDGEWLREVY